MATYVTKRIYDAPGPDDGRRVLVDRVWPRGMSKARAGLDEWAKDLAPSSELRTWFGHRAERFEEFDHRYRSELDGNPLAAEKAREWAGVGRVTLLYSATDQQANQAVVLASWLAEQRVEGSGAE